MLAEVLPPIVPESPGDPDSDYLASIGMPDAFIEAVSGDLLGAPTTESVGASAATATLHLPFGREFMIQRPIPVDASKQTPASVTTTATDPVTGKATELETDPE